MECESVFVCFVLAFCTELSVLFVLCFFILVLILSPIDKFIVVGQLWWACGFYRAMHFSAKRGIAIACRLSVSLSVCLSVCLWRWWIVIT